jgi:hypothetical protein
MGRGEAYTCFCWGNVGENPLRRTSRRWEDNIKIYLQELGFGDMDWIDLVLNRDKWQALVNKVMNLPVP